MTVPLLDRILARCEDAPDSPAITSPTVTWTYAMLGGQVSARTEQFRHRMRPGAVAGIVMHDEPEAIVHVLATAAAGRIPLLLPPRMPGWEERAALQAGGASYLAARGMFLPIAEEAPPGQRFQPGMMQLTSGSLGPSRPAFRTWAGIGEEVTAVSRALGLSATDRILTASSLAHSYAFMGGVLAPLAAGAHIVVGRDVGFDARPTVVLGLGSSYLSWLDGSPPGAFDSVRVALSAGAPLPEGLFDRFDEQFGLPIRQDYGTTETGTIALDVGEGADPTSVGRLLPHLEVRIGPEGGSEGEIAVRGNAVAQGYVVEGRLVPCTDDNGWYHTLDLGSLGNGGSLRLVGRERPGITIGGVTVDPAGVEAAVLAVPGTREAVALQVPTPEGQALKLVVTGDVRREDLLRWSKDHLAGLGGHVLVELRQDLPRSPAGKLLRKYLQ